MPLLEYQDKTLQGKAYNEAYSDYWNASSNDDGTQSNALGCRVLMLYQGQTVDAILMPVAPHAAVIPRKYYHISEHALKLQLRITYAARHRLTPMNE